MKTVVGLVFIGATLLALAGCAGGPPPPPAAQGRPVVLALYACVDRDFVQRFGEVRGPGRAVVNNWLWEAEHQMRTQFPLRLSLAGVGAWSLPAGAQDGKRIFEKYVPRSWPAGTRANCLIAFTGRKTVYWSGLAQWPRIFVKAQATAPVNEKTVAMLCHEISHWFGAVDIVNPGFPERSVMNYKDRRFGMVNGRVTWDEANRRRMVQAFAAWEQR